MKILLNFSLASIVFLLSLKAMALDFRCTSDIPSEQCPSGQAWHCGQNNQWFCHGLPSQQIQCLGVKPACRDGAALCNTDIGHWFCIESRRGTASLSGFLGALNGCGAQHEAQWLSNKCTKGDWNKSLKTQFDKGLREAFSKWQDKPECSLKNLTLETHIETCGQISGYEQFFAQFASQYTWNLTPGKDVCMLFPGAYIQRGLEDAPQNPTYGEVLKAILALGVQDCSNSAAAAEGK